MSKRVLLTGHGGFVGHHCLEYLLENTDWEFVCIDSFRHKGTCRRVVETCNNPRVKTFAHDLSVPIDKQLANLIFDLKTYDNQVFGKPLHYIINMASESAVERSTSDPVSCLRNNYELAINMLEFARKCHGLELFMQISTDEVYGEASPNGSHAEWDAIVPSNPYAASKAAQEALATSYWRTYDLPIVITNTMNIIGERQDSEKFLPKVIQKVAAGDKMPIYADSDNNIGSRVYLHAKNMADALLFLTNKKPAKYSDFAKIGTTYNARPDRYNICGNQELNNLELAQMVAQIMGKELNYELVSSESARPGYDRRYALNDSKLKNAGWEPVMTFRQSLEKIVEFTLKNPHWLV